MYEQRPWITRTPLALETLQEPVRQAAPQRDLHREEKSARRRRSVTDAELRPCEQPGPQAGSPGAGAAFPTQTNTTQVVQATAMGLGPGKQLARQARLRGPDALCGSISPTQASSPFRNAVPSLEPLARGRARNRQDPLLDTARGGGRDSLRMGSVAGRAGEPGVGDYRTNTRISSKELKKRKVPSDEDTASDRAGHPQADMGELRAVTSTNNTL
ncbi:hypothetical protein MG293_018593 [Ovis ammon polii]|uniref:Uncharacterized protein n=1 Tax=Ovis ammon polii TaxID=230172 RepID=A0AAD4TSC2_OVIAM|nr:hypothetical protein MG293_018593 [Ovis ammon polii]